MKQPNNGEDRGTTGYLLSPNESSSTKIGLHLIGLLAEGVSEEPQTGQSVTKTIGCFPQLDRKVLVLKTTSTQVIVGATVELLPTKSLHSYIIVSWVQEAILNDTKLTDINQLPET